MDLRQLRYFVAIAEAGSLSKAAERLRVAQPALSLQLANLEADLATRLFDRTNRGVRLTPSGTLLVHHANQVLKSVADATQAMRREAGDVQGSVSLGMPTTVSGAFAAALLERAGGELPAVRLRISEHSTAFLGDLLDAAELDIAILMNAAEQASLSIQPLLFESYCLVSASSLGAQPDTIELAQVAALPLLLPSARSMLRIAIEETALQAGLPLTVVSELDSARLLLAGVRAGIGHAILPRSCLSAETHPDDIVVRTIVDPEIRSVLQVASSSIRAPTPALMAVRELVVRLASEFVTSRRWDAELHWSLS